jgi:hypothetical protein
VYYDDDEDDMEDFQLRPKKFLKMVKLYYIILYYIILYYIILYYIILEYFVAQLVEVQFSMGSLGFFIDLLMAALWHLGQLSL